MDCGQCFCCSGRWWRAVLNPNLNLNLNRLHSSGTRTRTRCLVNLVPRECTVASIHTASTPKLWARIGRGPVLLDFARKSMERLYMETQVGLKRIALTLFLNLFFYFLLQLLCVMISHWLTVLKHKMPSQILIKTLDWFGKCCAVVTTWSL